MSAVLKKLFKEKRSLPQKIDDTPKKEKKIKKKDIVIEPIEIRELAYYEFDMVNNIKIYNGILIDKKVDIQNNIEFYKKISPHDIFTKLYPSTLTSRGNFTNIIFTEEDFIKTISIPPIEFISILKIGCNYGEVYIFPHPLINHDFGTMIKSVTVLNGKDIKIGCSCNPELLDVDSVLDLIKIINVEMAQFESIYKQYIKDKLPLDKKFTKKKITKILKNFQEIQNFKVLDNESIKELYNILEIYITDEIKICNNYMDNIIRMIKIFTTYEEKCTCVKKFASENDLSGINKNELVKNKKSSTRGRKPKEKKKSKRKVQGSGLYFSSQISFDIYNYHNKKISKIKLFRNGNLQVPGISKPNMEDLLDSVVLLKNYLNYIKNTSTQPVPMAPKQIKQVEIPYVISVMRNYTCRIVDLNITLILNKLEDILYFEKNMPLNKTSFAEYNKFLLGIDASEKMTHMIFKYFNIAFDSISEISLNSERYPGLLVKFNRPIPDKENKKLTVKILSSGKINFDGSTSELEVFEIYYWLQYIFIKYWAEITFDSSLTNEEVVSDDSEDGYLSLYDE
jgi:hypothetical protein